MNKLLLTGFLLAAFALKGLAQLKPAGKSKTVSKTALRKTISGKASAKAQVTTAARPVMLPAPAVIKKSDGTPDKRYRANRHLKKDGTPDRRYKNNGRKKS